jgi:predicted nucleotidyltransferase
METLAQIESKHNVRIRCACASGSRGSAFASPDTDDHLRFVYVAKPAWYLAVEAGRDAIERPIDKRCNRARPAAGSIRDVPA